MYRYRRNIVRAVPPGHYGDRNFSGFGDIFPFQCISVPQAIGAHVKRSPVRYLMFLLLLLAVPLPGYGHEQHTLVDGKTIKASGNVTGFPSHQNHVTRDPGDDAILVGIAGAEVRDHPCYMEFTWARRNDTEHRTFTTSWHNEPCASDESSDNSFEYVRLVQRDAQFGIASISVCNNNKSNKRLKGVKIRSIREVTEQGTTSTSLDVEGKFERPNCADWDKVSDCSSGQVATGINVYFDEEGATGLELICADVELQRELVTGPITEPAEPGTQHQSERSGYGGKDTSRVMIGTGVELPNASLRHYGITSVVLIEHNDRPCQVKLFGRALDWKSSTDSRLLGELKLDRCGNLPVWADALTPSLSDEGDLYLVAAEVACNSSNNNNNRIKGLKLLGGRIDDNGQIWRIDGSSSDVQPPGNCGDFSMSVEVSCRDIQSSSRFAVAVGMEMHHSDDAFTGFKLICRDVTVDQYPALQKDSEGF